jgi:hypothetical protein
MRKLICLSACLMTFPAAFLGTIELRHVIGVDKPLVVQIVSVPIESRNMIEAAASDVFLSYSRADAQAVEAVRARLREAGVTSFLDRMKLPAGQPWQPFLENELGRPATIRRSVDLPEPLGPRKVKNSPAWIESETSSAGTALPNCLRRWLAHQSEIASSVLSIATRIPCRLAPDASGSGVDRKIEAGTLHLNPGPAKLTPDSPYGLLKSVFLTRKPRQEKAVRGSSASSPAAGARLHRHPESYFEIILAD